MPRFGSQPLSSRAVPYQQLGIFRSLLPLDRLPHFQVDLSSSNPRRADDVGRVELADVSFTAARNVSGSLQSGTGYSRRRGSDRVAARVGRECGEVEGTGQSRGIWDS